jgi:inorganic pyrophosphatase
MPLISGCMLKVRPVAVIKAKQTEDGKTVRNDRIIGEAIGKEIPIELKSLQLTDRTVSQIEFFFTAYNKLYGKKFEAIGVGGPKKARQLIERAIKLRSKK